LPGGGKMERDKRPTLVEELRHQLFSKGYVRQQVIDRVRAHIKDTEAEFARHLRPTDSRPVNEEELDKFLTSHERNEYRKLLLQYLVTFYEGLPTREEIESIPVNPFEQFKTFVSYNLNLLRESDVRASIESEIQQQKRSKLEVAEHYLQQIQGLFSHISDQIGDAVESTPANYCKLFRALQNLCILWFFVKDNDIRQIRRSDVYIFQLTQILLEKYGCR
jgi:hypothetical protein